jgi:hypothetical protein
MKIENFGFRLIICRGQICIFNFVSLFYFDFRLFMFLMRENWENDHLTQLLTFFFLLFTLLLIQDVIR